VAEGAAGALFTLLAGFDKPFNQAPSLHIGLLVVLWAVYATRARGVWRWILHAWFALIGISVLTTYQHHLVDVPTGAAVGCFALFLFPVRRRARVAQEVTDAGTLARGRRTPRGFRRANRVRSRAPLTRCSRRPCSARFSTRGRGRFDIPRLRQSAMRC
jgi:membrane-associated phospholipid phosphatase